MAVVSVEEGLPQEKPVDTTIDDKGKDKEAEGGKKAKAKKEKLPTVSLFSLWRYSPGIYRFLAVIAAIFSLGAGVLQPIVIIVMGDMLNGFGGSADSGGLDFFSLTPKQISEMLNMYGVDLAESFKPTMLKFIYFGIAILVASYFAHAFWVFTSEKTTRIVRERYVQAILRQDIGWHDKSEEGSLATRLALDTQLVQDGIGEKLGVILQSFAAFVGGFVVAFVKGWKLALVIFACMPILMAAGVFIGLKIKTYTVKTQDVYARAGGIAEQAFSGIRTVYAFSLQNRFVKKYDDNLIAAEKCDTEKGVVFGVSVGLFIFALYGILGLAFWYGSRLVIDGEMLGGDVMVVFFGMLIGAMSLMGIPPNVQAVTTAQGAAHKVFGVIERNPTIDSLDEKGATAEKLEGFIEFRDVKFHYPTRPNVPVLKGLNLVIKPGQTVAFVGPSGSGKSTSVALVQRFYDAVEGEVLIDGKNVKEYNLSWLRKNIGVVGQEPVLFNMTIKENILMGTSHPVSEERLFDVCKMANCHNFISMLPNGYDTQVGEHGGMLSGGQKQRIAIARALIKNPQVLLLDEATSALDTASERIVQKALDVAAQNRTTITIAHRLSTIRNADLICVMAQGELVEQGTHNELLAKEGVYYSLVQKQKINMKEEGEEKQAGADEEVEVFNVPNQEALLKKPTGQVAIAVGDASAMLSMPDARTMTHHANARRAAEKKGKKAKLAALPKFEISRMMNILKGQKHFLTMGVGAGLIAGALSPVFAFLLAKVVVTLLNPNPDSISPGPLKGANLYSFLFAVVGLAGLISWWMQIASFEKIGAVVTRKLRRDTFAALLRQEIGFYDMPHHSMGALTSRLATDASNVYKMVVAWGEVAQFIATIGAGLAIGFAHAPALTGIILCLAPFSVYASYYQSKQMKGFEDKTRAAYEEASEIASEAIKEVRTVAALTRERWFLEKYSASLDHPEKLGYVKAYRDSFAFSLQHSIGQFMAALGFYVGITYIQDGSISFEQLFVTMMTVMISANSIGNSSTFMSNIDKGKIAAINIFEFLDRVSSINPDVDGYIPPEGEFNPDFNFENIAFTYPARPDQPIFTGEFNVSGKKNQTLALVGASGCGKSTTIGMLERWYDCAAGVVSVGGHDVKSYQLKAGLRRHMALVGQEPVLFDMSIGENILWGVDRDNVTQEEVERAATLANIHNFVSNLPDGYMTRVGDKGSQLSGGQKQRIAIARALIREPKILLLDEATSALDSESEKVVQEAIDKASEGRTTVTIAHRLSTIQNADQIAVVSGGKVVELGRHFELLALNGIYADLVKQQDLGSAPPS